MDIFERFNSIFFCEVKFITKGDGQLLLQSATRFITNCVRYHKVQAILQIAKAHLYVATGWGGKGDENALHLSKYRLKPGCHKTINNMM